MRMSDRSSFSSSIKSRSDSVAQGHQENDIANSAKEIVDFDELCEFVDEFEHLSYDMKKRINKLECGYQKNVVLIPTLKMCFQ
jgi:hypothetical protein